MNYDWWNSYLKGNESVDVKCDGEWHTWTDKDKCDFAKLCKGVVSGRSGNRKKLSYGG